MKRTLLTFAMAGALMTSCGSSGAIAEKASTAATLIQQLSPNSTAAEIANLFTALDANKDESISVQEAAGTMVADNFGTLDTDNNNGLNLAELGKLLGLLK
ncbi:MAG: hypothetical protein AAFX53_01915 [Bacteroidota bacterium]